MAGFTGKENTGAYSHRSSALTLTLTLTLPLPLTLTLILILTLTPGLAVPEARVQGHPRQQ